MLSPIFDMNETKFVTGFIQRRRPEECLWIGFDVEGKVAEEPSTTLVASTVLVIFSMFRGNVTQVPILNSFDTIFEECFLVSISKFSGLRLELVWCGRSSSDVVNGPSISMSVEFESC